MQKPKKLTNKKAFDLFVNILENNNPKIGSYKVNDYRVTVYHISKAETSAQRTREFYKRRRENDLCAGCGAKSKRYRCLKCRKVQRESARIRMRKMRNKKKLIIQKSPRYI